MSNPLKLDQTDLAAQALSTAGNKYLAGAAFDLSVLDRHPVPSDAFPDPWQRTTLTLLQAFRRAKPTASMAASWELVRFAAESAGLSHLVRGDDQPETMGTVSPTELFNITEGGDTFAGLAESLARTLNQAHQQRELKDRLADATHGVSDPQEMVEKVRQAAEEAGERLRKPSEQPEKPTFVDVDSEYIPFPLSVFPGAVRAFVKEGAASIGCDPALVAIPVLVACAGAIGNSRRVRLKNGWFEPTVIWAALVASSGEQKSPAIELALRALRERQRLEIREYEKEYDRWLQFELAQYEADLKRFKAGKGSGDPPVKPDEPICWRVLVDDVTIESLAVLLQKQARGLTLVCDELAGWVGPFERYKSGGASSDAAKWLEMFGARMLLVDRKGGSQKTLCVPHAAVSVCGGIQPDILRKIMTPDYRANGLSARLLVAKPPRRLKDWTDSEISERAEKAFGGIISNLLSLEMLTSEDDPDPKPELVKLSPEARELFIAFYRSHAAEQIDLSGELAAAWSKLEGYAARFSLVLHLMRWAAGEVADINQNTIDPTSMAAGIELADWFKNEARRVNALSGETPEQRDQRELVEWVRRQGGSTTPREMSQRWRRYRNQSETARTALSQLVKAGVGKWQQLATGGRPSERFVISESTECLRLRNHEFSDDSEPFVDVNPKRRELTDAEVDEIAGVFQ